MRYINPHFTFT